MLGNWRLWTAVLQKQPWPQPAPALESIASLSAYNRKGRDTPGAIRHQAALANLLAAQWRPQTSSHLAFDIIYSQLCKPKARSSACQTPAQISAWVITADPKHCMWLRCHFLPCFSFPHLTQSNNDMTVIFTCSPEETSESTSLSTYHLSFLLRVSLCIKREIYFCWTFGEYALAFGRLLTKKLFSRRYRMLPGNALSH